MADEKVSVIVPVYNVEKYLRRCLDSIVNQTYRNLEIILVDDGSPDNCGVICDEYARMDDRIIVIHQSNGGVSSARNAAMEKATGRYIVFVDSDDTVLPDYVKNMMAVGDADYVVSGCNVENERGQWSVWENNPLMTTLRDIKSNPELMCCIPTGMVWARRYKREIIETAALLFRCDISRGEDTLFNCIYLKSCDTIAIINTSDYEYRYNGTSATTMLNTNLFRWSMESVLEIGSIIGMDNQVFHERVWRNAISVSDHYQHVTSEGSLLSALRMVKGIYEICRNHYVRKSMDHVKRKENTKVRILIRTYTYPAYLLLAYFRRKVSAINS